MRRWGVYRDRLGSSRPRRLCPAERPIGAALNFGVEKYTAVPVPVLANFACPHNWDGFFLNDPDRKAARISADTARPRLTSCAGRAS
jgi:hypothetical protein